MTDIRMHRPTPAVLVGLIVLIGVAFVAAAVAKASLAREVQHGQHLADAVRSGQTKCSDLSADDFELIGEYAMNSYLPSIAAHEAVNQHMRAMIGPAGERRMHVVLGQRYSGCASGSASGWIAPMLGMMSRYGGHASRRMGPGMMYGQGYGAGYAPGHGPPSSPDNGDDIGAAGIAAIALGAALLAGLLVALGFWLRHRTA